MFQSIKNLLTMLRGSKNKNVAVELDGQFIFPETAKKLEQQLLEIWDKQNAEFSAQQQAVKKLEDEAEALSSDNSNQFQKELNARKVINLIQQATEMRFSFNAPKDKEQDKKNIREKIINKLRAEELEIIAHQGLIINEKFVDYISKKEERRIVKFNGAFWLVVLDWRIKKREVKHATGGYKDAGWTEFLPTGEYEAPTVRWATQSLQQFNNEELLACQQSQSEES